MEERSVWLYEEGQEILGGVVKADVGASEFVRRALRLAVAIAEVEGIDALPADDATEEEVKNWVKDRYPPDQWPEGFTE